MSDPKRVVVIVKSGSAGDRLAAFLLKVLLAVVVFGFLVKACSGS